MGGERLRLGLGLGAGVNVRFKPLAPQSQFNLTLSRRTGSCMPVTYFKRADAYFALGACTGTSSGLKRLGEQPFPSTTSEHI